MAQGKSYTDHISLKPDSKDMDLMVKFVFSEDKKIFSFRLGESELAELSSVCERYTLMRLERSFNTLEFYNTVKD